MNSRYNRLCIASGCVWALIACAIGWYAMPRGIIWGGIVASPFIGLAIGALYRRIRTRSRLGRVAMSLFTLYLAVALFGLATGLLDVAQGLPHGAPRGSVDVVLESIFGTLWAVTFLGYVIILWPMSHLNHWLLKKYAGPPGQLPESATQPSAGGSHV